MRFNHRAGVWSVAWMFVASFAQAGLIYYDEQSSTNSYVNTSFDSHGLAFATANGTKSILSSGGKRVTRGDGSKDTFDLSLFSGGAWDRAGLYDAGSGTVGGGGVGGTLYLSVLVRATHMADSVSENKDNEVQGAYAALLMGRSGTEVLGLGNGWGEWAYSIYGIGGNHDLIQASGGPTWLTYDTNVHLLVAKIVFNANANDDISVWLDPDPDDGDNQQDSVRRYMKTGEGDESFNQLSYVSGNIVGTDSWEFDEVRFGTDWASVVPLRKAVPIYYDPQRVWAPFSNTTFNAETLAYTLSNGAVLPVAGGKRVTPGTGTSTGTDAVYLNPASGGVWDVCGLYDSASGTIGGGNVGGVLYVGCLVRAHYAAWLDTERKNGDLPYGSYAGVQLTRSGTAVLGIGNGWDQWAYSIFGAYGSSDLVQVSTNSGTWVTVDTSVHMLVAKITYQPGGDDSVTVWLDPNPNYGDSQPDEIRRGGLSGDFSFGSILYGSGDIPDLDAWDLDEVRMALDWRGLVASPPLSGTIIRIN